MIPLIIIILNLHQLVQIFEIGKLGEVGLGWEDFVCEVAVVEGFH